MSTEVQKPWGSYRIIPCGIIKSQNSHLMKILTIKPMQRLSFQRHFNRKEIWVILEGSGELEIQVKGEYLKIEKIEFGGAIITIDVGVWHRAKNTSKTKDLIIFEVWESVNNGILSEDDIQRDDDDYGRV